MTRCLLGLLLVATCLVAKADEPVVAELTPTQEAAALRAAEATGLAIYRHDRAAAIATDAALKIRAFKKDKRVKGWVTEEQNGLITVTFIDKSPAALYRAEIDDTGHLTHPVSATESPEPLTEFESDAATARAVASESGFQRCADKYNSVVLPSTEGHENQWTVYLLPSTTKANLVPIGGTYRIQTRGRQIVSQRGFTRSCIALESDPRAVGLMITHSLDPIPTEAHVFWSLWSRMPLFVATAANGWSIENGAIRLVKRSSATD